jgi:hypothetical protein
MGRFCVASLRPYQGNCRVEFCTYPLSLTVLALMVASSSVLASRHGEFSIDTDTYDYLVQNVCADAATGKILHRIDPDTQSARNIDPGVGCPPGSISRDLRVGDERLPYLKHDRDSATGAIYQLSNAFPRPHTGGEVRIIHSLDFANHGKAVVGGLKFVQFDYNYDGFNINQYRSSFASIVGTADPSGGVQYFIANKSEADPTSASVPCTTQDAWGLWNKAAIFGGRKSAGSHVFRLNIVRDRVPGSSNFSCPSFYNDAFTMYGIVPNFTFASGKVIRDVLVQQHWAGSSKEEAMSGEKEIFTRAYGLTRWEAWARNSTQKPSTYCDGVGKTEPGGWTMVDCRDWSFVSPDPDHGYVPSRFPTPPYLVAGGNFLDNGDFGRGMDTIGNWRWPAPGKGNGTNWTINSEASGNIFLLSLAVDGGSVLYQDVPARADFKHVRFGVQAWVPSPGPIPVVLGLLQMDAKGSILQRDNVEIHVVSEKKQFRSAEPVVISQGVVTLRFQVFLKGGNTVAIDNCWLGPS